MALATRTEYAPQPYETLSSRESLEQMLDAGRKIIEHAGNTIELKQGILHEAVLSLYAYDSKETDADKKDSHAKNIFAMISGVFSDEKGYFDRGIKGEVCTRLALDELGFETYDTVREDDFSAIDLFADTKGERGPILAIQVKADSKLDEPLVQNLTNEKYHQYLESDSQLAEEASDAAERIQKRISENNFLRVHPEFSEKDIIPIMIRVPSGQTGNYDRIAAFKRTGEPTLGFTDKLYEQIETALGWEEY